MTETKNPEVWWMNLPILNKMFYEKNTEPVAKRTGDKLVKYKRTKLDMSKEN